MFSTTDRQHVFTRRQTACFADYSATPDEYGLTTAANNRLQRHKFGAEFRLHAQPAN